MIFCWNLCFLFSYTRNLECLFKSTVRHSSDTVDQMLDHNKFADKPGQAWDAKKQCELLLLDGDARAMNAASAATEMNNNVDSSQELLLLLERTEVTRSFGL